MALELLALITYNGRMHNTSQPDPPRTIPSPAYYHLIHDVTRRLPPPVFDTPEALYARNQAAIEKVAAMLPVNPVEADLAALCVATRAQADDAMRLLRVHAGDIQTVMKLNAQYVSMVRTSLSAHNHLMKVQALRHKREAINSARDADEWTQHVAAGSMHQALDAGRAPVLRAAEHAVSAPAEGEPQAPVLADAPPLARSAEPPAQPPPGCAATLAKADAPPRDLAAEAEHYAIVHPGRAREIRYRGGLPPVCGYGPPDDELVQAIISGATPALRALGANAAAT